LTIPPALEYRTSGYPYDTQMASWLHTNFNKILFG